MGFKKYQSAEKIDPVKKDDIETPTAGQKPKLASVKAK